MVAGVVRNENGEWKWGYHHHIGTTQVLYAEISAIWEGLRIAIQGKYAHILIESDSMEVIQLLQKDPSDFHPYYNLILHCRQMIQSLTSCILGHVYREANQAANALVQFGKNSTKGLHILYTAPVALCNILWADAHHVLYNREVNNSL